MKAILCTVFSGVVALVSTQNSMATEQLKIPEPVKIEPFSTVTFKFPVKPPGAESNDWTIAPDGRVAILRQYEAPRESSERVQFSGWDMPTGHKKWITKWLAGNGVITHINEHCTVALLSWERTLFRKSSTGEWTSKQSNVKGEQRKRENKTWLINPATGQFIKPITNPLIDKGFNRRLSPDGSILAFTIDKKVYIMDLKANSPIRIAQSEQWMEVKDFVFSEKSDKLLVWAGRLWHPRGEYSWTSEESWLALCSTKTGHMLNSWPGKYVEVPMVVSPDGRKIASAGFPIDHGFYDPIHPETGETFTGKEGDYSWQYDYVANIWRTGQPRRPTIMRGKEAYHVAQYHPLMFSRDSRHLLAWEQGTEEHRLHIGDATTGAILKNYSGIFGQPLPMVNRNVLVTQERERQHNHPQIQGHVAGKLLNHFHLNY